MSLSHAIVLGLVQGLTEFLPVSSSAHLRIVPSLLGWGDPGTAFAAVAQLGTLAALVVYFHADLWRITRSCVTSLRGLTARATPDALLGWYLGLGTIPIVTAGVLFQDQIESEARSLPLIGGSLVVFGLILLVADQLSRKQRGIATLTMRDAVVIGCAQAFALVPGVSRSGATISAGLLLGLERAAAARYSFLLSVPAVLGSGVFELNGIGGAGVPATLIGILCAFAAGYASIALLLRFLVSHSTGVFVAYRVALGVLVLILAGVGTIS